MIFLGSYDEITPNKGYPSMKNSMMKSRYKNQDKIVRYLRHGKLVMVAAGLPRPDVFTGETIKGTYGIMSDDVYAWSSMLPYYVDKYNLKLPDDFERHIGVI